MVHLLHYPLYRHQEEELKQLWWNILFLFLTASLKETGFEVEETPGPTAPPHNCNTKWIVESLHKL